MGLCREGVQQQAEGGSEKGGFKGGEHFWGRHLRLGWGGGSIDKIRVHNKKKEKTGESVTLRKEGKGASGIETRE